MKIKTTFILFSILILVASCKKDIPVPEEGLEHLFGKWTWVSSNGGLINQTTTPETENYIIEIEYKKNGVFKKYKDGKKVNKMKFKFEKGQTIFSVEDEYSIKYTIGKSKKVGVVPHYFQFIGTDTLVLKEECFDCLTHIYVRK